MFRRCSTADDYRAREFEKNQDRVNTGFQVVPHTYSSTGTLEYGNTVVIRNAASGATLANDVWTSLEDDKYLVFGEDIERTDEPQSAMAKSTFIIVKVGGRSTASKVYNRANEKVLQYGQVFQLMCNPSLLVCKQTGMLRPPMYITAQPAPFGEQIASVALTKNSMDSKTHFVIVPAACALNSNPYAKELIQVQNHPVKSFDKIAIKSCMLNLPMILSERLYVPGNPVYQSSTLFKIACSLKCAPERSIWQIETSETPEAAVDTRNLPKRITQPKELLSKIRELLCNRCNNHYGIREISREFRIMDTSGDGRLDREELIVGLGRFGIELDTEQTDTLLHHIDTDKSGAVEVSEFLTALRGPLSKRRLKLIMQAYNVLDFDGNGKVELAEICKFYDTSCHPDVIDGRQTHEEVLKEFVKQWDNGGNQNEEEAGDGIITKTEFIHYYRDISAGIDDDDYFELMIRNAWHISGGTGWCENSSNIRCLVVHSDGSQEIVELKNDFGISRRDMPAIKTKLRQQGVTNIKTVSLAD